MSPAASRASTARALDRSALVAPAVPAPSRTPQRPPLRVVAPLRRRPARAPFILLVATLLTAGLVGLLLLNTTVSEGSFEVQRLRARSSDLSDRQQELEQLVARDSSPSRLAQAASKLGMVPTETVAFLRTSNGEVRGVTRGVTPTPGGASTPGSAGTPAAPGASPGAGR